MKRYDLSSEANQEFSVLVDGHYVEFRLHTVDSATFADVKVDGEYVACSLRCVGYSWLIPYDYQHQDFGNFRFETSDENYPHYTNYGTTCFLYYYDRAEWLAAK